MKEYFLFYQSQNSCSKTVTSKTKYLVLSQHDFVATNKPFDWNKFHDKYWTARQRGSICNPTQKDVWTVIVWFIKSAANWPPWPTCWIKTHEVQAFKGLPSAYLYGDIWFAWPCLPLSPTPAPFKFLSNFKLIPGARRARHMVGSQRLRRDAATMHQA